MNDFRKLHWDITTIVPCSRRFEIYFFTDWIWLLSVMLITDLGKRRLQSCIFRKEDVQGKAWKDEKCNVLWVASHQDISEKSVVYVYFIRFDIVRHLWTWKIGLQGRQPHLCQWIQWEQRYSLYPREGDNKWIGEVPCWTRQQHPVLVDGR